MDERKMTALTAHLEGQSTIVKNIGRKVKVSQMELVCLCTFARLGLLEVFSNLDGEEGYLAAEEMDELTIAVQKTFATEDNPDGLARLAQSCVAILGQSRLGKYVVTAEEQS